VVTFDTLAYAKRLRGAGLTDEQAFVHAEALATALGEILVTKQDLHELATKDDLHRVELATKEELASVRQEMRSEMGARFASMKHDVSAELSAVRQDMRAQELRLTLRMGALISIGIGALAAILKMT
jgi:Protein of unknown function (DUF1640)